MIADRKWVERNIGFDPVARPAPVTTFAFKTAATSSDSEDIGREIIDFDSEAAEGREFLAFTTATGLSRFTDIPWPKGLEPKTDKTARKGKNGALPAADVLVVTWTVDEGHALSRVLTPGKDSRDDYVSYTHNFDQISKKMRAGCPARIAKRLGTYWTGKIGTKSVVYFKSDSHMSQDGPKLPNIDVWTQLITEVQPQLVLTTGTAGGIGAQFEVGDVIVSPVVRFDCIKKFKAEPFHASDFSSAAARTSLFTKAKKLFAANADQLPGDNSRPARIFSTKTSDLGASVVTTDFFGFDTSDDHFKLQGLGNVSEMGDAVLGLVAQRMNDQGLTSPRWVAVRNVSDPQIKAEGTITQQAAIAAQIYKAFGRWSSVCSAIVCWALIAAEQ
jgi:purine-nucleoside phosphorylase